jgi:hypothetical protein
VYAGRPKDRGAEAASDPPRRLRAVSDLPQESLSYQAVVAEYFLGLRGAGLLISPLDAELVAEWERRGLPVAVVCRGLRDGLDDASRARLPGAALPRSIRALRFGVEDAWRAYQAARVGEAPSPPPEAAAAARRLAAARALVAEARRGAAGPRRAAYDAAATALAGADRAGGEASPLAALDVAFAAADAAMLTAWLTALPAAERAAMGPRIRLRAGPRPRGASRRAHRETLRAHLGDLAREAGLSPLRGSV